MEYAWNLQIMRETKPQLDIFYHQMKLSVLEPDLISYLLTVVVPLETTSNPGCCQTTACPSQIDCKALLLKKNPYNALDTRTYSWYLHRNSPLWGRIFGIGKNSVHYQRRTINTKYLQILLVSYLQDILVH